ncbi:hypothetical protein [Enterococcus asini]|uniref:EpsG family protein n=1 Tax=Enterococcus asini TaxID=57732 RepID=A0AAW8TYV0_9ENTE|nr:hypothetical protein [Enterococcus asini]MDT2811258.1 hypothetical protein [Enterococcus asini]
MILFEVIFVLLIGLISPVIGIFIGTICILIRNKPNYLTLGVVSILIGYIGSYYQFRPIDDMARYVFYMDRISIYDNILEYLRACYTDGGISIYGVNAANWPLSGIILYITQKYGDYRLLSGGSLAFVAFVRYFLVVKCLPINSKNVSRIFLSRLLFLIALCLTAYPVRVLSGFRWWISMTTVLLALYFDYQSILKSNKRLVSNKVLLLYVIAGLLHPSAYIYLMFRLASGYLTMEVSRVKKWFLVVAIIVLGTGILVSGKLTILINQFLAYTNFDLSVYSFMFNFAISGVTILGLSYLFKVKQKLPKVELIFLLFTQLFTVTLFPLRVFDRMYQFSVPVLILFLLLDCRKRNGKITKGSFVTILAFLVIYLTIYVAQPDLTLPQLREEYLRVFFLPVH